MTTVGQRGHQPHLQLHDHRSGRGHVRARRHRVRRQRQPRSAPTRSTPTTGAGSFVCSFPDGPAQLDRRCHGQRLRRRLRHRHAQTVTVANVAPTVTLTGDAAVNEGTSHTYSFTITDPGADTFVLDATELRRRTAPRSVPTRSTPPPGAGSFECSFPDGPASSIVSVHGQRLRRRLRHRHASTVTVANVAPTVTLDR